MQWGFLQFLVLLVLAHAKVHEYDDLNYHYHINKGIPTILYLYAPWCGYCKQFTPIFEEIALNYENLGNKIQFAKIDADKNKKVSEKFRVEYLPTLRFINGKKVTLIKSREKDFIREFIKQKLEIVPIAKEKPKIIDGIVVKEKKFHIKMIEPVELVQMMSNKNMIILFSGDNNERYFDLIHVFDELDRYYTKNQFVKIAVVNKTVDIFPEVVKSKFEFTLDDGQEEAFISLPHINYAIPVNKNYTFINLFNQFNPLIAESEEALSQLGLINGVNFSAYPDLQKIRDQAVASESEFAPLYEEVLEIALNEENTKFWRMYRTLQIALADPKLTQEEFFRTMAKTNIVNQLRIQEDAAQKIKDLEMSEIRQLLEILDVDLSNIF